MSIWHVLAVVYAAVPAAAWLVLLYAGLDDVLDLALYARVKGVAVLFNVRNWAGVVAHDYGSQTAVRVAVAAFAATFVATGGNWKQAFFFALSVGAAAELPNLKADVLRKLRVLLDAKASAADLKPYDNIAGFP